MRDSSATDFSDTREPAEVWCAAVAIAETAERVSVSIASLIAA